VAVIDSGPISPTDKFDDIPKTKWRDLVRARKSFLAVTINYDCRCLIEFCEEAELVYAELGYKSAEDLIREGYELNPTQIELAVAWLKHNEPQEAIGLKSVSDAIELARANKDKQKRGPKTKGDSTNFVEIGTTNSNSNILRRLARDHEDILAMVESGELSVNAAAIRAGIRKKPTPLRQLLKWWKKATLEEQAEFLKRKDEP
jgi:Arc/MetJ-type ribon-helix-helix transcriptional regulator